MKEYDVLVIGGGPGGYVAAIRAAQSGKRTAVAEREHMGGVCLNWGCIPTKSLLRNAEIIRSLSEGGKYGFSVSGVTADYAAAQKRSREVSGRLTRGIDYLMKKNGVDVITGEAFFTGVREVAVGGEVVRAKHVIIAAGSRPFALPMLDYSRANILDSKKALQLTESPESIVIIGAGAIGLEFATVFSSYGAKVDIVEMLDAVAPNEDGEVSALIEKELKKQGIGVHVGTKVTGVEYDGDYAICSLSKDGKEYKLRSRYVLGATGVRPNSEALRLEACGVETDRRGYIVIDEHMRTSAEGVYAIGDITGKLALAHTASAQGLRAVDDICCRPTEPIVYENIPRCTYTAPEIASAGLTERAARTKGGSVGTAVFPLSANGKAIAYGEDTGFIKLVFDTEFGQLLGVHMVGPHTTEMIGGLAGFIGLEVTTEELAGMIYPHPTVSEAVMEAAHVACGEAIHI